MRALAELEVTEGQRMRWSATPPVVLRRTGPARMHVVQAAGGPLGDDELELRIRLAADTELTVGSAGATVAQPGRPGSGPARWTIRAQLAPGARLRWLPQPTVVCDGATLHTQMRFELALGSAALVREEVGLGRYGQLGGRYRGVLAVDFGGAALLRHTTVLDGADRGLSGPGGSGGARVIGTLFGAGAQAAPSSASTGEQPGLRWARQQLAGPGWLLLAAGKDAAVVSTLLDGAAAGAGAGRSVGPAQHC